MPFSDFFLRGSLISVMARDKFNFFYWINEKVFWSM